MSNNYTTILENKRLISVSGDESKIFLNNIITNDVNLLSNQKSLYSCLLSPQGKVLCHFFLIKMNLDYIIIVDNYLYNDLVKLLNHYKLRSRVNIEEIKKFKVLFSVKKDLETEYEIMFVDPRNEGFGNYYIFENIDNIDFELSDEKYFQELINSKGLIDNIFEKCIGKYFLLECNLKELNAVNFKKGCYIGQENTSRMNLKNKISKRILRLITNENLQEGEDLFYKNEVIGKIISKNPNFGIIKINKFDLSKNILVTTKSGAQLELYIPKWM